MKNTLLLFSFLFLNISANAQLKKTVHQTFEIGEARNINLEVYGEYEIESWSGNTIMSETKIELYDASPHILKFFMKEKERYMLTLNGEGEESVNLVSNDKERRSIQYKGKECFEQVKVKLYIPEDFIEINPKTLRKKDE
ncbi:MAG: hypothetical protein ACI85O_001409 [Saprospiraceae bacterium]|jgi:hypothetical protein